ncbi:anaerobic ribonucleoside-triphosphate reductase activating protein [Poseidonibacter lekithochrous]|uniref:anaerobic ribonucleoside-triphosphate reductase activating protein n=1 Tax=Poseidonibacter lekithochrous TaxID=1904463 RepID=UPI0008FC8C3D|nr:anaerobic ribonucleoside-triphosphate reductase activating protein [Poseidonibacter lekithochrous]QKJ23074.1 anaerobic ribonucleoside triphosphate reductase activating protein [Poseidonibacter lekithochrous]
MNKELNLLNLKNVYSLTKFTTTDYAGHLSCVVWLNRCNFRCLYCYNNDLVFNKIANHTLNDVLEFLKKRTGLLDAVVISGGEATQHDLIDFCKEVKALGFKIKLDTNATDLKQIQKLIELNLLDYMAIDFKAHEDKFYEITKKNLYNKFIKTIQYLISIDFDFELRTTVNSLLLDEEDINRMIDVLIKLGYKNTYYLQNFLLTSSNIGNIKEGLDLDKSLINAKGLDIQWRN